MRAPSAVIVVSCDWLTNAIPFESSSPQTASSVTIYNEILKRRPDLIEVMYRPIPFDTRGMGGLDYMSIPTGSQSRHLLLPLQSTFTLSPL